jgi:hypothetical protein
VEAKAAVACDPGFSLRGVVVANYLKIPDVALGAMLQAMVQFNFFYNGGSFPANWRVRLFNSAIVPSAGDTLGTYTPSEATFSGYAPISYSNGNWSAPVVAASIATIAGPLTTFTCTVAPMTPETIYGYFIDAVTPGDVLLWAQLFDTPLLIAAVGNYVQFTPQFQFSSRY